VLIADVDAEGADSTRLACEAANVRAFVERVDVGDEAAMERFAAKVAEVYGTPDVVVNNAGIGMAGPLLETSAEDWSKLFSVNVFGVIHGCRLFGKQMRERGEGGHIVNLASMAAFMPSVILPAYATSKAAVLRLSECLHHAAEDGVIVGIAVDEEDRRRPFAARFVDGEVDPVAPHPACRLHAHLASSSGASPTKARLSHHPHGGTSAAQLLQLSMEQPILCRAHSGLRPAWCSKPARGA
jgi:NAD(P)-dependent dehydrogenase (short-subunit alcohol dehydrogenase family)